MPCSPGTKIPGQYRNGAWFPMSQWSQWCDKQPPDFLHEKWEDWPDAGMCLAHGAVVGLDVDTDRREVSDAAQEAVGPSPVRRVGRKGWMGYYRPGEGVANCGARLRWYDPKIFTVRADGRKDYPPQVELLLHGTQSVLPPTIHPDTGQPYRWISAETLEDTAPDDLPELPANAIDLLDAKFTKVGLVREIPRRVSDKTYDRPIATSSDHDLEKPFWRALNDKALLNIDLWWPNLNLPKSRQRGAGSWEAVPFWRASNSGHQTADRNPNLKAYPTGIVDFGANRSYTSVDVVMDAKGCSEVAAKEWLLQYFDVESAVEIDLSAMLARHEAPQQKEPVNLARWSATPVFHATRSRGEIKPSVLPTDAEFEALVPRDAQPFPISHMGASCPGLLGEIASYIDEASVTATEAGGLAVALPLLGAVMGRAYQTPSGLRTNVYTVALGGSGTGKTSLVNPSKELLQLAMRPELIGQDRIASGSGLIQMLTASPSRVVFLDEFGHMLQQIGSPGAGVHARQIITEFTQLYSAAGTLYTGTAYASREPDKIDCPHLCLFGMATPEQFWRAFGSSSLEDGSIARYLVMPIGATGPKDPSLQFQREAVEGLKCVSDAMRGAVTGNLGFPGVRTVPLMEDADAARQSLLETMRACADYAEANSIRGGAAILRRVVENALKIALISAVGRSPSSPQITAADFNIGHALARWSATLMIWNIASHIADNQTERDVNDVEEKIRKAGSDGVMKGMLKNRCRTIKVRDFSEIVDRLIEAGVVVQMPTESRTKPGWRLVHADCIKEKQA